MSVIDDLLQEQHELDPAAEALRQALNQVIAKYQLSGDAIVHILARLSAGYIHQMQQAYNQAGADVIVEEDFQNLLQAYLTSLDMSDLGNEMHQMAKGLYS